MSKKLLDAIYLKKNTNNTPKITKKDTPTPEQICFDKIITACYEITEKECLCLNYEREQQKTIYKKIEVGLQLPNSQGQLIRFIPRYVTVATRYIPEIPDIPFSDINPNSISTTHSPLPPSPPDPV